MNKQFLIPAILMASFCAPAAKAQNACNFFFFDAVYYRVSGARSGSALDFHAETGGGKRLMHSIVPESGSILLKATKDFQPHFVINVDNEQTSGSKKALFFSEQDFSVKDLGFKRKGEFIEISCTLKAKAGGSFRLLLSKQSPGMPLQHLDSSFLLPTESYDYTFEDRTSVDGASYMLAVVSTEDFSEVIRSAPLSEGKATMPELFPNPASDRLRVRGIAGLPASATYSIYNLAGALLVHGGSIDLLQNEGVSVKEFAPGLYVMKIASGNNNSYSIPFQRQ